MNNPFAATTLPRARYLPGGTIIHTHAYRLFLGFAGMVLLAGSAAAQVENGGAPVSNGGQITNSLPSMLQANPNSPMSVMTDVKVRTKVNAPSIQKGAPVTLEADEMGYDKDSEIAIARGHVVITQSKQILKADEVIYYRATDIVEAKGNVVMLQPTGEVYFADHARLTESMKHGIFDAFKARLADNSVFVAEKAIRVNPAVTELHHSNFTPCQICEGIAPFWNIKSVHTTIDENDERIYSHDVSFDLFGLPIFYTPYFSDPTPDAQAKSGFLAPSYSHSTELGYLFRTPYYWRIDHSQELTLTPWIMPDEANGYGLLQAEYDAVSDQGVFNVRGSITDPQRLDAGDNLLPGHQLRGHIYADGIQEIGDYSRVGFDLARTTDDTYLRRYGFGDQTYLFSRLFFESAQDRNYLLAQTVAFQGLELADDPGTTPLVLPDISGYYETKPLNDYGLRFHIFGDTASITTDDGPDERRLSTTVGADMKYVTDNGMVLTPTVNLREDLYAVDHVPIAGDDDTFSGTVARFIPQASLEGRYPLIRQFGDDTMTIEPIVLAIAQPYDHNTDEIPNVDNTLIELNQANLFSLNRMPGYDTIDSGPRLAYGARTEYLFSGGESINGLLGQDYNFDSDTPFPNSSNAGKSGSDIIGALGFDYYPWDFTYDFAINSSTGAADQTEIIASYNQQWISVSGAFRSLEHNQYLPDSKEGILNASVPIGENWIVYAGGTRNLTLNQMVAATGGVIYRNECFNLILNGVRVFTVDRDVQPDTSITLRIGFKDLGEFGER